MRDYVQAILDKIDALAIVKVSRTIISNIEITFEKFVVGFPAIRNGFNNGYRPFIGIGGCHLKGHFKGVMLLAVALDENSGV